MANKIKHDRSDALQKATDLFWEKGFHATSMRNIQEVTDMRPGSIYTSFGSKEGLFKQALHHYASETAQQLNLSIAASPTPLTGLKAFIRTAVIENRESAPSSMCMLVKSISELSSENEELLVEAKRLLKEVQLSFSKVIQQAQEQGEIETEKCPDRLARSMQMQLMGLRAYSRANDDEAQLEELVDDALESLH